MHLYQCCLVVVGVAGVEQADDGGTIGVKGAALVPEMAAYGAGDAVSVHLAYVLKPVAGTGAAVIPLLEELLVSGPVATQAPAPIQTSESSRAVTFGIYRRQEYAELVPYTMPEAKM